MPFINIDGVDIEIEVGSFSEDPDDEGVTLRRSVNGDSLADIAFVKHSWPGTAGPFQTRADLDAFVALCDFPNPVPVWGDVLGVAEGAPIDCRVRPGQRRPVGGLSESGAPYQVSVLIVQV